MLIIHLNPLLRLCSFSNMIFFCICLTGFQSRIGNPPQPVFLIPGCIYGFNAVEMPLRRLIIVARPLFQCIPRNAASTGGLALADCFFEISPYNFNLFF